MPTGWSIARYWDARILDLIRITPPAPGVHARNLFHLSVAMWDAWAAYDPAAQGYLVTEKRSSGDIAGDRAAAISFAAYGLLKWRYFDIGGLDPASYGLELALEHVCFKPEYSSTTDDTAAALGNRIAAAVIEYGRSDGALEAKGYRDRSYVAVNESLAVGQSGTLMVDPNLWQPIKFGRTATDQGGRPAPGGSQKFVGAQWGHVTPFALPASPSGTPLDPGPPPRLGDPLTDQQLKDSVMQILRYSSTLDPRDDGATDISPAALGNNRLGANDGHGREVNPVTGQPYAPNVVSRADFRRSLAEFWADGPNSETPPGHWNVIANAVSDAPGLELRIGGSGSVVDRLEWDVKMYFALNGALHDAAIAAWGLKRWYETARPISLVRYMAGRGQSSDPDLTSYDPAGLPLVRGLVELITFESSSPGARHAKLAEHVGEIALRAWRGFPDDPTNELSGVGWVLGVDWVPYQRVSFVTPAFPGYVSGHSTFSRAAAEVLTAITGSEYFPGGLQTWAIHPGDLRHESGPRSDVTLQWATYYDAADQAGISRLYMGIHFSFDDLDGRLTGSFCGTGAWQVAQGYFA